ncbi:MAG TPA: MFS transporter, partial [Verrucomicrobiae bacterium]|nr:MFS transporter [Verrucomicrobiae bacterium]
MDRLSHREQMLSLKFSTMEACFSVPMLNLTLPNFPFVVAFAVEALGWKAQSVGWMAALPHVCNFLQPFILAALARGISSYELLVLMFTLGALPWGLAGLLPAMGGFRSPAFACMLIVGTMASSLASVAWSASISEVVPERISGRYFARRNLIFGGWTLLVVMIAGEVVDWHGDSLRAFSAVFCAAGVSRLMGLFFLTRMRFPQSVMQPRPRGIRLADLAAVLRDSNYRNLCIFVGVWGLLLNAAMPFYTVFLLDRLELGIGSVVVMTTLASLGGLVTLKSWGRLSDRFGNRPVLQIAAIIWALTALVMWAVSRRGGWTV